MLWQRANEFKAFLSRQSVNAIETGRYDPSLPLAFTIAEVFGLPIEAIFSRNGDPQ
jgi:putative transcriptional regulator